MIYAPFVSIKKYIKKRILLKLNVIIIIIDIVLKNGLKLTLNAPIVEHSLTKLNNNINNN